MTVPVASISSPVAAPVKGLPDLTLTTDVICDSCDRSFRLRDRLLRCPDFLDESLEPRPGALKVPGRQGEGYEPDSTLKLLAGARLVSSEPLDQRPERGACLVWLCRREALLRRGQTIDNPGSA